VDSHGYAVGVFTGSITVSATTTDVAGAPQTVPVTLAVARFYPRLAVAPSALRFLADMRRPGVLTGVVVPTNTGYHVLTWTASVSSGLALVGSGTLGVQITPTLVITTGRQGAPLTVTLDSTGYSTGVFIGLISVGAIPPDTLDAPPIVPVILRVAPEIHRVYLPLITLDTDRKRSGG
jgi:hypothetical protein